MADDKEKILPIGKQVRPRVRVSGDDPKKGETGIVIIRGKKEIPIEDLEPEHKAKK